jgi:hypothetical protein
MVIRSQKIKRTQTVCVDDAHWGWNGQQYREKVIAPGKVPLCRRHAHRVRRVTQSPPPPGPTSLCSVCNLDEMKIADPKTNKLIQLLRENTLGLYYLEVDANKLNREPKRCPKY